MEYAIQDDAKATSKLIYTSDELINAQKDVRTYSADTIYMLQLIRMLVQLKTTVPVSMDNLVFIADLRAEVMANTQRITINVLKPMMCNLELIRSLAAGSGRVLWFVTDAWDSPGIAYVQEFKPITRLSYTNIDPISEPGFMKINNDPGSPQVDMNGLDTSDKPTRLTSTKPVSTLTEEDFPWRTRPLPVVKAALQPKRENKRRKITI